MRGQAFCFLLQLKYITFKPWSYFLFFRLDPGYYLIILTKKKKSIYISEHCAKSWFHKWARLPLLLFPKRKSYHSRVALGCPTARHRTLDIKWEVKDKCCGIHCKMNSWGLCPVSPMSVQWILSYHWSQDMENLLLSTEGRDLQNPAIHTCRAHWPPAACPTRLSSWVLACTQGLWTHENSSVQPDLGDQVRKHQHFIK